MDLRRALLNIIFTTGSIEIEKLLKVSVIIEG